MERYFFILWDVGKVARSYRSRDDIVVDILEAASGGAKKTHIMQRANLNPVMFKKYFPMLLRNGFLVVDGDPDGGSLYRLSGDGRALLKMFRALRAKFRKDGIENFV
jgi:predicted transcriptional regulator